VGFVNTEITLKNAKDVIVAEDGLVNGREIRQATVTAVVDTRAITLVINEKLRQQLGLEIQAERQATPRRATLANDETEMVRIADPVTIHWKNRGAFCRPLVISDEGVILLGAIPLEDMDLAVDPVRQELTNANGDEIVPALR
jgi:hypothetical protein